nr:MAG TPA: hypothetical protein [Crassvirales sp.]DAO31347.1 MAG TPA: hypothetical protein [Crassvirales sp.]
MVGKLFIYIIVMEVMCLLIRVSYGFIQDI